MPAIVARYSADTFGNPVNVALTSAPNAANALISVFSIPSTSTLTSVTDNSAGTPAHTQEHSYSWATGSKLLYVYRRYNASGSPSNVTFNFSASSNISVMVAEVSGLAGTRDKTFNGTGNGVNSATSVTTDSDLQVLIGIQEQVAARAVTAETGYVATNVASQFLWGLDCADLGLQGVKSPGTTWTTNVGWVLVGCTFRGVAPVPGATYGAMPIIWPNSYWMRSGQPTGMEWGLKSSEWW